MKNKKRILMITDPDGIWTIYFIKYLYFPRNYEIVIFPIWGYKGKFADFYKENNIKIYQDNHKLPIVSKIPVVRKWVRILKNSNSLKAYGSFDIVHNHYLSQRDLELGYRVAKRDNARFIASFWGSDLARASNEALLKMKPYLLKADGLTCFNLSHMEKLKQVCGEAVYNKAVFLVSGNTVISEIDKLEKTVDKKACKKYFGIKEGQITLAIGYSASSAQQQLQAVTSLEKLPLETRKKITIVLQQTYGEDNPEYVKQTHEMVKKLGFSLLYLHEFMDGVESAYLRMAVDIYVHSIITDSLSASMVEYLYAGAKVLKGEWLKYQNLDDLGIKINSFENFEDFPKQILACLDDKITSISSQEREKIRNLFSWERSSKSWQPILEGK